MTRPRRLAVVASWPIEARQAFGERFNSLAAPGLGNYVEAERLAFEEVATRLAAGELDPGRQGKASPARAAHGKAGPAGLGRGTAALPGLG